MTTPSELRVQPPPTHTQPRLLDVAPDKELTTPGEARTRYGRVAERIVCELLNLAPITINGNYDVCYDAHGYGRYFEIKSVRKGSSVPLYEWRREKDLATGLDPIYVFAVHDCTKANTLGEVWERMSRTLNKLFLVPSSVVSSMVRDRPLRQLVKQDPASGLGYKRKGYCEGYRNLPLHVVASELFCEPLLCRGFLHKHSVRAQAWKHLEANLEI